MSANLAGPEPKTPAPHTIAKELRQQLCHKNQQAVADGDEAEWVDPAICRQLAEASAPDAIELGSPEDEEYLEISAGEDTDRPGLQLAFARFLVTQAAPPGLRVLIPHDSSVRETLESLDHIQRFIENYWASLVVSPLETSFLVAQVRTDKFDEQETAEPLPYPGETGHGPNLATLLKQQIVDDAVPFSWPQERFDAAAAAVRCAALAMFLRSAPPTRRSALERVTGGTAVDDAMRFTEDAIEKLTEKGGGRHA